jgi:exo-beta-1,3-glucanase (GH17 family)
MKSLIFIAAAVSLLSVAFAQPHGKHIQREIRLLSSRSQGHRHVHPRADVTDYVTVTAPEVVVWVDHQGCTVSIETRNPSVSTSMPAPLPTPSVSDTPAIGTPSAQISAPVEPSPIPSSFFASPSSAPTEALATTSPDPAPAESTSAPAPVESASTPTPPPGAKEAPTNAPAASYSDSPTNGFEGGPPSEPATPPTSSSAKPAHSEPEPSGTQGATHQAQGSGLGLGITWSPYMVDSNCKSQDQANSEFAQLAGEGFSMVRIYGIDCNQVAMTIAAVSQYNMAIFAGLISLDNLATNLNSMITQVRSNWHMIDTVSIGNELVNNGLDPGVVVAALDTARGILNPAGYAGRIVTVDVFDQFSQHPELCQASDYCAANCHAFFDSQITADQAGDYVSQAAASIASAIPGKDVMITESGWPWAGAPNGAAVPSPANQQTAIGSLKAAFANNPGSLMVFDSYDAMWKQPGPFGVEQYFGMYGH